MLSQHADFSSGANTDLLGRRWFLVGGNVFCFIGHLVVATAKSNKAVIVGMGLYLDMRERNVDTLTWLSVCGLWWRQLSDGRLRPVRAAT